MEPLDTETTIFYPYDDANPAMDRLPTHSEDGIDLTLIRWMLSLTQTERLRTTQRYARSAKRLRNVPRMNSNSRSPTPIIAKEETGREKDKLVLPILRRTLEEIELLTEQQEQHE